MKISNWPEGVGFQPHGLDVHHGSKTVYAISHVMGHGGERVEVMQVNTDSEDIPTSLTYLYSITTEEMNQRFYGNLNSLSIIRPNLFYISMF